VHSINHLYRLAEQYSEMGCTGAIVTQVLLGDPAAGEDKTHAMWAITSDGMLLRFAAQAFARFKELADASRNDLTRFGAQLPQRTGALGDWNVFALICGKLNII
jgi:predicted metal-binding membrane protein